MTKWLVELGRKHHAQVRLVCFPYAGAAAGIFRGWPDHLPGWLDVMAVELPGRASRFRQPPLTDIDAVVAALAAEFADLPDRPCVFYGHSLGAKIAFELACHLGRRGRRPPAHLVAAARAAPDGANGPGGYPADLGDDDFLALLSRLGATPPEILENRELMELLLPTIRADFRLNLSRSTEPSVMLTCPVVALHGTADAAVPAEAMRGWGDATSGGFELLPIEGGHFFLDESRHRVLEAVTRAAEAVRARG